jgi:hypothetical protein
MKQRVITIEYIIYFNEKPLDIVYILITIFKLRSNYAVLQLKEVSKNEYLAHSSKTGHQAGRSC